MLKHIVVGKQGGFSWFFDGPSTILSKAKEPWGNFQPIEYQSRASQIVYSLCGAGRIDAMKRMLRATRSTV